MAENTRDDIVEMSRLVQYKASKIYMPDIESLFVLQQWTFFYISFQKLYEESKCHHLVYSRCVRVNTKQVIYMQSHTNSAKQNVISMLNNLIDACWWMQACKISMCVEKLKINMMKECQCCKWSWLARIGGFMETHERLQALEKCKAITKCDNQVRL